MDEIQAIRRIPLADHNGAVGDLERLKVCGDPGARLTVHAGEYRHAAEKPRIRFCEGGS
jgi:hypothetical protein